MRQSQPAYTFNLLLLGPSNVGKTHLIYRYTRQLAYLEQKKIIGSTIGFDFTIRDIEVQGKRVRLKVNDSAGNQRYRSNNRLLFKDADAIILVYDIINRQNFDKINQLFKEVQNNTSKYIPMMLFGNKCDMKEGRQISFEEGANLAQSLNMFFYQTSAFKGTMIQQAIMMIVTRLKQQKDKQDKSKASKSIILDDQKSQIIKEGKRRGRCC